jgi:hypothetical protein
VPDTSLLTIVLALVAAVIAGQGFVRGVERLPVRWRRLTRWALIGGAAVVAIAAAPCRTAREPRAPSSS